MSLPSPPLPHPPSLLPLLVSPLPVSLLLFLLSSLLLQSPRASLPFSSPRRPILDLHRIQSLVCFFSFPLPFPPLPFAPGRFACLPLTPPLPSAFMDSSRLTSGDDIYDWVQGSTDSEVSRAAPPPSSSPHPSSLAGVLRAHPVSHRARLPGVGSSAPRGDACGRARLDRSAAAVPD